jgi:putative ABC transport system permease protein
MLRLLARLGIRDLTSHRLRTLLTLGGIALGVSMPVSIGIVNRSISDSFRDTVAGITGKAVLQVTADENGFDEAILDVVKSTRGVHLAAPLILGSGFLRGLSGEAINVFGVDLLEDGEIRTYREQKGIIDDPVAFLNQPDSIILTTTLADRIHVGLEDQIELQTVRGLRTLTVRALINPQGPLARAFAGHLAIMDVFAAQTAFGKDGKFDEVDMMLDAGESPDDVMAALQPRLAAGVEVRRPEYRSGQVDRMLRSFQAMLSGFGVVALLIGVILAYNTMSIAVAQRRREIGILRALGVSVSGVTTLFILECFLIALAGSALGAGLGMGLARVVLASIARAMSTALVIDIDVRRLVISPAQVGLSLVLGVIAGTMAGALPARRASRVPALEAMSLESGGATRHRVSRAALAAGAVLLLSVPIWSALVIYTGRGAFVAAGDLALYVGITVLIPFVVIAFAEALRRPSQALLGAEGLLGCDGVTRWADRTAVTVAVLAISISFAIMIGSLSGSFKSSLIEWLHQAVPVDFTISSDHLAAGWVRAPLDEELGPRLAGVEGVERVLALRMTQPEFRGRRIMIKAIDVDPACDHCGQHSGDLPYEEGGRDRAITQLAGGGSVLVSNNFSEHFGTHIDDVITLDSPFGSADFRVAGVIVEYTSDQGVVVMNRADFRRVWHDDFVNYFNVFARHGADLDAVHRRIAEAYGEAYRIRILDSHAQNAEVMDRIDQSFKFVAAVKIVAFAIALLGIVNTLLVSILERVREIAVLRALGMYRAQVSRMVLIEAMIIGLVAAIAGCALGGISSAMWVQVNFKHLMGWVLRYSFAAGTAVTMVAMALAVALLASILPARVAARTNVVEGLVTE